MKFLLLLFTLFTFSCTNDNAKLQARVNNLEHRVDSLQVLLSGKQMGFSADTSKQISFSSSGAKFTGQCMGITKKGKRCTRKIKSGTYCWQHGG